MHACRPIFITMVLLNVGCIAHAQTLRTIDLPDAPQVQAGQSSSSSSSTSSTSDGAGVTGMVLDASGAAVAGAMVSLSGTSDSQTRKISSQGDGSFVFRDLPQGTYTINVSAAGFSPPRAISIDLTPRQGYNLPAIVLAVASTSTDVNVRPVEEVAAEQVHAEEKQRVFGVIPNYFTSYTYDAAPMTARQKFSLTARDTFDPVSFIGVGVRAGIEQANNTYPGYGLGAAGYGKRFGAALGDTLTGDFLGHALFPALLHQDPRYFYQGSGTRKERLYHAVSFAFLLRNDKGGTTLNWSYLLGDLGSGALSNLYYPHADRGAGLVFSNAAIAFGGRAAGAIVREFLSTYITTNIHGKGKP